MAVSLSSNFKTFAGIILFCVIVVFMNNADGRVIKDASSCAALKCKAGRECTIRDDGVPVCTCIRECPEHRIPICGSNGATYMNHCHLHREACVSGKFISQRYRGPCRNGTVNDTKEDRRPVACFRGDRDHFRSRLIATLQSQQKSPPEPDQPSSYSAATWLFFSKCDTNHNAFLDADEFLDCVRTNVSSNKTIYGEQTELLRALCVDAIVDIGDRNHDWRLEYKEFQDCVDPEFKPKTNNCFLYDKEFHDGYETTVGCNRCVCACGHWVCTSVVCFQEVISKGNGTELVASDTPGENKLEKDLSRDDWSVIP